MDDLSKSYQILGLKPGATSQEAKQAYRDLVNVWHPDRFNHDERLRLVAQDKLKEINVAYETVKAFKADLRESALHQSSMKSSKQKKQPTPTAKGSAKQIVLWGAIILGIVVLSTVMTRQMSQPTPNESILPASRGEPTTATNTTMTSSQAQPDFQKLKGKWLRPDGGYVIDFTSVASDGKLEASYLNPRPIHVSKAEAKPEAGSMKVFIELQDVNYPGSTYTLTYLPERDLLVGTYYQALQRQSFEVYFERLK